MIATTRARLLVPPAEGWISLLLVAILGVSVAWSLDDAALVLGQREVTDFLPWVTLGGVAVGFVGARARWSRPVAHLIGAAFAALVVPIVVGGILEPGGSLAARYQATAGSTVDAFLDFAVRHLSVTRQTGHYMLVLGMLCWANGQFAASAVFRHSRPLGPIIVLGTVLVANMSATIHDQIWFLVLFSMASLFLLTRLHALDERATWIRRRIGDPAIVTSLYLRGGTVFILIAIFGSLALTATARSAPLAGFWDDARPALVEISQWLQRIIPAAPDARSVGVPSFGQQVTIGGIWSSSHEPALDVFRSPGDDRPIYWRATTYDRFTLFGWASTDPVDASVPANGLILQGTLDAIPEAAARTTETFRVVPQSELFKVAFSPIDPISISIDSTLTTSGEAGFFQGLRIQAGVPYQVSAAVPELADIEGGVTVNRLRAAGRAYPEDILRRYTAVPQGSMGVNAEHLLSDIKARMKSAGTTNTPYDIAAAIETELHNTSRYTYSVSVPGVCDDSSSTVECFATHRTGFCEHFASTMAILLRREGIPARLVEGFLPGQLDVTTGREQIQTGAAHAWVEVYFPNIGWYRFDPTGALANTDPLPVGSPRPIPTATPIPSLNLGSRGDDRDVPDPTQRRTGAGGTTGANGGNGPMLVALAIGLLAVVVLVAFLAWRRGPRNVTTADGFYASVAGIARRFGFGPRPTQTAFEYAAALGDVLPAVRPELQTVATAKVEVVYGRRDLPEDRVLALRDAYRRLRVGLLRLAFRRRDRRRMR
ncbi:MAG TPA: transglutaminase domain-containing protein [Candidatus Limnocylindrales bacterium]